RAVGAILRNREDGRRYDRLDQRRGGGVETAGVEHLDAVSGTEAMRTIRGDRQRMVGFRPRCGRNRLFLTPLAAGGVNDRWRYGGQPIPRIGVLPGIPGVGATRDEKYLLVYVADVVDPKESRRRLKRQCEWIAPSPGENVIAIVARAIVK